MSEDSAQSEELHDLRQQLATALQHIAEQQRAIADLGRRLEQSLSAGGEAPGAIGGATPGTAAGRHGRLPVVDADVTPVDVSGEVPALSQHPPVFVPRVMTSSSPQSTEPTVEPVQHTRFVVQQAHELADFSLGGRESLAQYLSRFEEHCAHVYAGGLDRALPLLKSKFSGRILDVFIACGDVFSPYLTVKSRMLEWAARQEEVGTRSARDRFRRCRKSQGESVALYALRLASVFNDAYPDQDMQTSHELQQHLLDNLPPRAADYLRRQIHYTQEIHGIHLTWRNLLSLLERERLDEDAMPDTDPSLFYTAEQDLQSRRARSQRRTPASTAGSARRGCSRPVRRREATVEERQCQQHRREHRHSSSSSSSTGEGRSLPRCYFCGHPGHLERECRRKQGLCFSCGRPGHYVRDCSSSRLRRRSQSVTRSRQGSSSATQGTGSRPRERVQSPTPRDSGRRMRETGRRGWQQRRHCSQGDRRVATADPAASGTSDVHASPPAEN